MTTRRHPAEGFMRANMLYYIVTYEHATRGASHVPGSDRCISNPGAHPDCRILPEHDAEVSRTARGAGASRADRGSEVRPRTSANHSRIDTLGTRPAPSFRDLFVHATSTGH